MSIIDIRISVSYSYSKDSYSLDKPNIQLFKRNDPC